MNAPLFDLAALHGVHAEYHDLHGRHHPAHPETLRALLRALGVEAETDRQVAEALAHHHAVEEARILADEHVVAAHQTNAISVRLPCDWTLLGEDGKQIAAGHAETAATLPGLEAGYYSLIATHGGREQNARLLARPARAPALDARAWGVTGALYGLRSGRNGGLGSYTDLATACAGLAQAGAQFLGVNPIHALGWAADDMISPYSPTHRGFYNIDHIAPAGGLGPTPEAALVDYPGFRRAHRAALEAEFAAAEKAGFTAWQAAQGPDLEAFCRFEALSERYGPDTRDWPAALQSRDAKLPQDLTERATFHAWLQYRAEAQIDQAQGKAKESGMGLGLYLDLAVGPRPGGAEVWMNPQTIAKGVTIGAPPDHLSPEGQSWALAAHAPGPLAAAFYAPLRAMLRKLMQRSGLLRIDHALGLLRSFWIPDDGSPGGYISQPLDTLLAIIAIEADRTGCVIVGEDLGLVPDGFRARLGAAGLYSYAVWQYETFHDGQVRPPSDLAANSLACFGTHDTPTTLGFWYGHDIEWWQRVGWLGSDAARARHGTRALQRASLRGHCGIGPTATAQGISHAIHVTLAQAPSALMAVQMDDIFGLLEAQNLPGTIEEHPNWRRRYPVAVEDFAENHDIAAIGALMPQERRPNRTDT